MVSKSSEKILINRKIKEYSELIEIISKMEYKKFSSIHLIDYSELINIGTQTIHTLIVSTDIDKFSASYIATAIKWAIRNEVRRRYKWYSMKTKQENIQSADSEITDSQIFNLREAVYKTILSVEEMAEAEVPTLIKDTRRTPDQKVEFIELSNAIKDAIKTLPSRERDLIEAKFIHDKKLRELQEEFNISQSRLSRIIQSGLNKIRKELVKQSLIDKEQFE